MRKEKTREELLRDGLFEIPEGHACYQLANGKHNFAVIPEGVPPVGVKRIEKIPQGLFLEKVRGNKYKFSVNRFC